MNKRIKNKIYKNESKKNIKSILKWKLTHNQLSKILKNPNQFFNQPNKFLHFYLIKTGRNNVYLREKCSTNLI